MELKTTNETAEILRVKPVTIRKWLREGLIGRQKMGSRVLIRMSDIASFMEKNYHPARKERNNV
ncbi:MAG: helix-turn-helix domain-containing protein [Deltaproteobacteria bacterium]|nr:helix-turn-helix domain-containing protein [Deltaproteobacteria bacterium]MBW2663993.1 helix-turn-helix domain-containing protein [Deltaproteobacteria bacterium]